MSPSPTDLPIHEHIFNGPVETGIRSLIVLNATHPAAFDLTHLVWFDHLVVHTHDVGGPESLHPDLPQRSGELLVRRRLIEDGLKLMQRLHLIEACPGDAGILYRATEEAAPLVGLMKSTYTEVLKERAKWLAENIAPLPADRIREVIEERIGSWHVEFQTVQLAGGQQ